MVMIAENIKVSEMDVGFLPLMALIVPHNRYLVWKDSAEPDCMRAIGIFEEGEQNDLVRQVRMSLAGTDELPRTCRLSPNPECNSVS